MVRKQNGLQVLFDLSQKYKFLESNLALIIEQIKGKHTVPELNVRIITEDDETQSV